MRAFPEFLLQIAVYTGVIAIAFVMFLTSCSSLTPDERATLDAAGKVIIQAGADKAVKVIEGK